MLLAATLPASASAQSHPAANLSLEARVQHLEDLEEIRTVLTDYGRFLDARDFYSYSHLFAKDGEWIGGLGKVQGPAEIQAFMEKSVGTTNNGHNYHCFRTSKSKCVAIWPRHGRGGPLSFQARTKNP
jgi:hypothetical protein